MDVAGSSTSADAVHVMHIHVWNFESNFIGGIIVVTFVFVTVDGAVEGGEVAEGFRVVAIEGGGWTTGSWSGSD